MYSEGLDVNLLHCNSGGGEEVVDPEACSHQVKKHVSGMFGQLVSAEGNAQTLSFLSGAHLHVLLAPVASLIIVQRLEGCPLLTVGLSHSEVS